jgi:hypothetical protein
MKKETTIISGSHLLSRRDLVTLVRAVGIHKDTRGNPIDALSLIRGGKRDEVDHLIALRDGEPVEVKKLTRSDLRLLGRLGCSVVDDLGRRLDVLALLKAGRADEVRKLAVLN